ncbi:MAG: BatD family protein [Lentisphaeria bacterium]|nr:BatD family protein [Lentisphaeria bacterium]
MKTWTKTFSLKMWLGCCILFSVCCLYAAPKVEISVSPDPVRVGEPASLVIRSNDGARNMPLNRNMPKIPGLTWHQGISQSQQTQIINGRRSDIFEIRIRFTVDKKGNYTIPALNLTHSKEKTKPVTFEAVEARYSTGRTTSSRRGATSADTETVTLDQVVFLESEIPGKRSVYYVGEEIPLEINMYYLASQRVQATWPEVSFGSKDAAVLRDYSGINPENPRFSGYTSNRVERDGKVYNLISFRTAFRPISAGQLSVHSQENAVISIPDTSRRNDPFDDDFFGGGFFNRTRQIRRNVNAKPLSFEIRKLPPVTPANGWFSGLIGRWRTQVALSPAPYKVGEPVTLKIEFQGNGSLDTLFAKPLDLPGFRVYPPEIEKSTSSAEVRYVLIPTETADGSRENIVLPPILTFDPGIGKYIATDFRKSLVIAPGSGVIPSAAATVVEDTAAEPDTVMPEKRSQEDVLYLKKEPGHIVLLPLHRNYVILSAFLILAGVLFFIIALAVRFKREAAANDPGSRRRQEGRRLRKDLIVRLNRISPEEIPAECSGEIAECLAAGLELPPGADLDECAKVLKSKNPEFAEMLEELSQAAWMPSMKNRFTAEFKTKLIRMLGRVIVLTALLLPFGGMSAEQKISVSAPARNNADAMNAYDSGKFEKAFQYYSGKFNPGAPSADLLYNMGNCLYKMGRYPAALICYERALRLSPRDPDILENLNLVRRKLQLPERYRIQSPSDVLPYLRDSLRPDEWIFLFCFGITLCFAAAGVFAVKAHRALFRSLTGAAILFLLVPLSAYVSQQSSSYNPDHALVSVRTASVYSLPSEQTGKVEMQLKGGEEVLVMERRMNWVRIRSGNAEGWIHADDITSLWSPNGIETL